MVPNADAHRQSRALAARAFLLAHRIWLGGVDRADRAFIGIALGLLSRAQLHAIDEMMYAQRPRYQSDAHNRSGLFPWEAAAVHDHFADARRIAVIGAGGGRELLALARRGHVVDGFECNPVLVESAQRFLTREACTADVRELPRDAAPAAAEPYDGVIVGWSAYMLIAGRERRVRFLHDLRAIVRPDAPLLLSFFTRPDATPRLRTIARIANVIRSALGRERVAEGDELVPNLVHRFTANELRAELHDAGFALVSFAPQGPGPGGEDSGWAVARPRAVVTVEQMQTAEHSVLTIL